METGELYGACMDGDPDRIVSPTHVYRYVESPFSLWCEFHAPEDERDARTEFIEHLFEQGMEHERDVVHDRYPEIEPIEADTPEMAFRTLLESMAERVDAVHEAPLFYLPEGLRARVDILERRDGGPSVFGDYHYVVREVKSARNIQDHHRLQAAATNYVLGRIQQYTPDEFYVINRDRETSTYLYDESEVTEVLDAVQEIAEGAEVDPVWNGATWPWESYCNRLAKEREDVSLLDGVGPAIRKRLVEHGFRTIDDIADATESGLQQVHGIGPAKSDSITTNAQAIVQGEHIRVEDLEVPDAETEIVFDLEGTAQQTFEGELVDMDYLIGCLLRQDGNEEFVPFVAHGLDEEGEMFQEFADWVAGFDDVKLYHWHNYENWRLERMADTYEVSATVTSQILDNLVDLHQLATGAFTFPTYGHGLKQVAAYMGFEWRQEDVSATETISMYFQYARDPDENEELLEKILRYNEDDCEATRVVKDWLVAHA